MKKISNEIRKQIIDSYIDYAKDKLSESQIETAVKSMRESDNSIEAHLAVGSLFSINDLSSQKKNLLKKHLREMQVALQRLFRDHIMEAFMQMILINYTKIR